MNYGLKILIAILTGFISLQAFSQAESEQDLLGLPGDNLDLYAVLDVFQKSPTIEEFEKSLNSPDTKINNLDLNLDEKVDFIKVKTEQKDQDFSFILQTDVTEEETQDVAVILLSKDENEKVTLQIVGDKALYGDNYVIEPKPASPAATPNPAYTGNDPAPTAAAPIIVETTPIVQYVYSPVYVPYYPPYHYAYYPPYFTAFTVMTVAVYRSNHYYYPPHYHGGYGNTTVVIHNHNTYNNYYNNRNSSNTVNRHSTSGNYNRSNTSGRTSSSTRPSGSTPNRSSSASGSSQASRGSAFSSAAKSTASTRPSNSSMGAASKSHSPTHSSGAAAGTRQTSFAGSRSGGSYRGAGRSGGGYSGGGRSGASRTGGRR